MGCITAGTVVKRLRMWMMNDMTFGEWLGSTLDLQRTTFKIDPTGLHGDELADYIRWNVLAATDELHEYLQECPIWKPWSKNQQVNTIEAVNELVDVLHFIANLLVMHGVSGEQLTALYHNKQEVNAMRQLAGYDGVTEKCPICYRDMTTTNCTPSNCAMNQTLQ